MTTEYQSLQAQIDALKRSIRSSAEIVTSLVPLTGAAPKCCVKFGINITTGILYYVDVNRNWQQAV